MIDDLMLSEHQNSSLKFRRSWTINPQVNVCHCKGKRCGWKAHQAGAWRHLLHFIQVKDVKGTISFERNARETTEGHQEADQQVETPTGVRHAMEVYLCCCLSSPQECYVVEVLLIVLMWSKLSQCSISQHSIPQHQAQGCQDQQTPQWGTLQLWSGRRLHKYYCHLYNIKYL